MPRIPDPDTDAVVSCGNCPAEFDIGQVRALLTQEGHTVMFACPTCGETHEPDIVTDEAPDSMDRWLMRCDLAHDALKGK